MNARWSRAGEMAGEFAHHLRVNDLNATFRLGYPSTMLRMVPLPVPGRNFFFASSLLRAWRKNRFPTAASFAYHPRRPRGWPARRMDRPAIRALTGAAARETTGAGVPACEPNVRNG
jgi:hypothetical protein